MNHHKRLTAAGRPSTFVSVGQEWVGWTQLVAHPDSPHGSGGPGNFSPRIPLAVSEDSDLPSPWRPGPTGAEPLDTPISAPKPPNAPPVTNPSSLGVIKEVQSDFADYRIEGEILADG